MPPQQQQAQRTLRDLIAKYRKLSDAERKTLSEANVVAQFIQPLLDALGWPTGDPARFKYELHTHGGRPDITLFPDAGGTLFVEAKRFGVVQELKEARKTLAGTITPGQLALPGMATDRTAEEQQAINYAFTNGGTWAILTNFEKLRLFNARRDWLVLSFEKPEAYLDEFDLLWQIAYGSILDGDLERLSNQRHREDVDTEYLNFINTWRERLAQDIVAHPQRNPWAFTQSKNGQGVIRVGLLRTVVQRLLDRLVVVRFAEDHSVIPAGTLQQIYDLAKNNPYTFPLYQSFQQLYRRFDEFHNSALFAPHPADRAVLSDPVLGGLVSKLYEARYRALSADIMGNTYEQYLGKTLVRVGGSVVTADNLETRKKQGSYYTPQVIVRYIVDNALGRFLYATANGRPDGERLPDETPKRASDIASLRLIDPACGSGSFLIYAYQLLADFYRREQRRIEREWSERINELSAEGLTPIELQMQTAGYKTELDRLKNYPRLILERHLYGVDLDPQAAEIATVNLIMRAMADQPRDQRRLPLILNQNVKVGNSLIGAGAEDERYGDAEAGVATERLAALRQLRLDLIGEGGDHDALLARIDELARGANDALNTRLTPFFDELPGGVRAQRPFHWGLEFPEVFFDEAGEHRGEAAGFDIVVGNPPWEIVKPDYREYFAQFDADIESKLTRKRAEARVKELVAADSTLERGWQRQKARIEATASYYKRSTDFTRQGRGDTATHKLFTERGFELLRHGGKLGFVIPSGIYTDLGTKPLREMLLNEGHIEYLYNFSNERFFFPHVDHRVKFTLLGAEKGDTTDGFWATFRFNPRVAVAPDELDAFLADAGNLVYIRKESLAHFSPDSLSVMEFQTQRDYDLAEKIFDEHPLMGEEESAWNVKLNREFDVSNDRQLLNRGGFGYNFYEGKTIHQFNSSYGDFNYWIAENEISNLSVEKQKQLNTYRVTHRRIARTTDERTLIAAVVPPRTACENNATVALIEDNDDARISLYLVALLNSFVLDYIIRYKVSTTLNMFYMYQLPLPRLTAGDPIFDAIVPLAARLTCTTPAFAALWQQVVGTAWSPEVAAVDPVERAALRRELDALVAHLYGLSRDEFDHILRTFPLVFPNDEQGRAKQEALLAVYDRWVGKVR